MIHMESLEKLNHKTAHLWDGQSPEHWHLEETVVRGSLGVGGGGLKKIASTLHLTLA